MGGDQGKFREQAAGSHADPATVHNVWEKHIKTTEAYNEPGRFTAFLGYEWTSMPGGDNIHRNVLFRDGGDKALQIVPFSAADSEKPEDLWKQMEIYEQKTGGRRWSFHTIPISAAAACSNSPTRTASHSRSTM